MPEKKVVPFKKKKEDSPFSCQGCENHLFEKKYALVKNKERRIPKFIQVEIFVCCLCGTKYLDGKIYKGE
jgi:hypothetical protein